MQEPTSRRRPPRNEEEGPEDEDSYAGLLREIEDLRVRDLVEHDDWPEWRRTVIKSVRSGERLENLYHGVQRRMDALEHEQRTLWKECARSSAVRRLVAEFEGFKQAAKRRERKVLLRLVDGMWGALTAVLVLLVKHWLH